MSRLDPQEELEELTKDISVKEYTAARKVREVHALIDEINELKADREVVAEYVRTHPAPKKCDYGPCDRVARVNGLCDTHYHQMRRNGVLKPIQGV